MECEMERLKDFFSVIKNFSIPFSIDTFYSEVARMAIERGVMMVNDVSGGRRDEGMLSVIRENPGVKYVVMFSKNFSGRADLLPR